MAGRHGGPVRVRLTVLAGASMLALSVAGCESAPGSPSTSGSSAPPPVVVSSPDPVATSGSPSVAVTTRRPRPPSVPATPRPSSGASVLLAALAVKGRAPRTGYERALFGQAWSDDVDAPLGHNGCDTRNDVLRRDLRDVALEPGTNGCVVLSGVLDDPYSGRSLDFVRGPGSSSLVQIDHVVALSDAWQKGAQRWDATRLRTFANDPLNLLAVDGPLNQQKRDGDAATWLPPNKAYRCSYVARQVAVKARYGLWVTAAERDAIARVLAACPGQPAPTEAGSAPPNTGAPPRPATSTRLPAPVPPTGGDVYYANCAAARAAGAAPLRRGEPGYRSGLDGDGDGIACE